MYSTYIYKLVRTIKCAMHTTARTRVTYLIRAVLSAVCWRILVPPNSTWFLSCAHTHATQQAACHTLPGHHTSLKSCGGFVTSVSLPVWAH